MKEEYIKNYLDAFKSVLESFTSNAVEFKSIDDRNMLTVNHDLSIIIGFVGDIRGQVSFIMEKDVAMSLSSILAGGMEITEIDELVKSAMGELGNMIMGNACTLFSKQGVAFDITPPTIITGQDFHISNLSTTFRNDIIIDGIGKMCFDVSLKN